MWGAYVSDKSVSRVEWRDPAADLTFSSACCVLAAGRTVRLYCRAPKQFDWTCIACLTPSNDYTSSVTVTVRAHDVDREMGYVELWASNSVVCVTGSCKAPTRVTTHIHGAPEDQTEDAVARMVTDSTGSEALVWYTPCRDKVVRVRSEPSLSSPIVGEVSRNEVRPAIQVVPDDAGELYVQWAEGGYSRLKGPGGPFLVPENLLHP
eukprot:PhM_4_TR18924/c0_g1_i2/m.63264